MKKIIVIISILLGAYAKANPESIPDRYVQALIVVESRGNSKAIGDHGRAYGILQIHQGVIQDVNRWYGLQYRHRDAFDPVKARKICKLYTYRLLNYKNKQATLYNVALCWNRNATLYKRYAVRVRSALVY